MEDEVELELRLQAFARRLDGLERRLDENTTETRAIRADTAMLVEFTTAFLGFAKVARWTGKLVKPIGSAFLAIASLYVAWRQGK